MDRHPQQIKRERQDKKRRVINIAQMSGSTKYVMIMILINILQTHTK